MGTGKLCLCFWYDKRIKDRGFFAERKGDWHGKEKNCRLVWRLFYGIWGFVAISVFGAGTFRQGALSYCNDWDKLLHFAESVSESGCGIVLFMDPDCTRENYGKFALV